MQEGRGFGDLLLWGGGLVPPLRCGLLPFFQEREERRPGLCPGPGWRWGKTCWVYGFVLPGLRPFPDTPSMARPPAGRAGAREIPSAGKGPAIPLPLPLGEVDLGPQAQRRRGRHCLAGSTPSFPIEQPSPPASPSQSRLRRASSPKGGAKGVGGQPAPFVGAAISRPPNVA